MTSEVALNKSEVALGGGPTESQRLSTALGTVGFYFIIFLNTNMQNPRYYHNVAVIYIEFYNCYAFDAIYALHEKLDNMVMKHNILKAYATCHSYIGLANVLSTSSNRDAFYFAANICNNHYKIGIAVGSIVFNHVLFVGSCITNAIQLSTLCEPNSILIDNNSLMYLDYDRFSVETFKYSCGTYYSLYDLNPNNDDITLYIQPANIHLKYSVLIIDDSTVINKIMSKKLSSFDICVHTATSVDESIKQQQMFYYDAVIIDIYLSDTCDECDGLNEAQRIRDCNKDIFICGMTGQEPETFAVSDIFNLFIFKPWTNAKYNQLVSSLKGTRRSLIIPY
jgi:CheY-like chemotaxis protein